ncbi:DoxX family protein [Dokdonella sp.]|uniref:DoxX family protein n=1 Tax=Dokdonella sp. TaxID=2291710 RepID=UPI0025C530DA|nr:DoxX family protein [Dokdonella sp.]
MIDRLIERYRDALILLARILLTMLFVISGFGKLTDYAGTVSYMNYVGAPMPSVAAAVAIAMEVLVGLALLVGFRVRPLALLMMVFVAGTAILGHPFWAMDAAERALNQTQFLKNLSIMGGLLLLAIVGAGRYSLGKS